MFEHNLDQLLDSGIRACNGNRADGPQSSCANLWIFTDDSKEVELFLLNRGIAYEVSQQRHFAGDRDRPVSVLKLDWEGVTLNLAVYCANDERGTLKTTPAGRPMERAGIPAVTQLLVGDA